MQTIFLISNLHYRDTQNKVIEQEHTYDVKSGEVTEYVTHDLMGMIQGWGELGGNLPWFLWLQQ